MTALNFPSLSHNPKLVEDLLLGMRLSMSQGREIQPTDIFKVLNSAKLKAVLVGAHAVNAHTGRPRATVDVDLIAQRPKFVVNALKRAFPHLKLEDHPVVFRFKDDQHEAIDVIKPQSLPLFKVVLDSSVQKTLRGVAMWIPNIYAMLALKFASMVSPTRQIEDRYIDGRDFILIAKGAKSINTSIIQKYGEAVYSGGGKELSNLVARARAGERLDI